MPFFISLLIETTKPENRTIMAQVADPDLELMIIRSAAIVTTVTSLARLIVVDIINVKSDVKRRIREERENDSRPPRETL